MFTEDERNDQDNIHGFHPSDDDDNYCSTCGLIKCQHTWLEQKNCWDITKLSRRELIQAKITDFLYNEEILNENR